MENLTHKKCLICSNTNLKILNGYEKHNLVKCRNCGLVFIKQIPTNEELDLYYNTYSYRSEQEVSPITKKRYQSLLDEFEQFRKTNNLLDIGCGQGFFLYEAKKRGWNVFGTEFSPAAVEICQKRGIKMKEGQLNITDFELNSFDVITSFEVFEHINNPFEEIQNICYLLRQKGLFYCTTPNFNSLVRYHLKNKYPIICYPEHLIYFTKTTLNKLLTSNNFKKYKFLSTGFSLEMFFNKKNNLTDIKQFCISNDNLRENIEKNKFLRLIKAIVNYILTVTNLGLTLKGYFLKN